MLVDTTTIIPEAEQYEEFEKCSRDFEYFAINYIKITHPIRGLVPFVLYGYQQRVISDFENHKHNIVRKFRQGGLTTLATLWSLWRCIFKLDQRILVLSKSDREAKHAGSIVTNALKYLPDWINPTMVKNNDHEKIFADTNSSLEFYTPEAARSKALTYLIIDEAAFISNMEEHWKSMYPTVATGGRTIVISTVNGLGNWYEEMYHGAEQQRNQFHVIDIHYKEHPDYNNEKWAREMKANLGEKGWQQEVLGSFLGSGETYIHGSVIQYLEEEARKSRPIKKLFPEWENDMEYSEELLPNSEYQKGALWIWKMPEASHEYMLSADAAEGVGEGGDNSAFHVIDVSVSPVEQVAEFYSNIIPPHLFAQVLYNAALWYNDALLIVENMGPGLSVLNKLIHTLYYDNLYYETKSSKEKAGVTVQRINRPIFLEFMQNYFINKQVIMHSPRIVRELKTFVYNKVTKRAEAQKGKHDDLVMALSILLHAKDGIHRDVPIGAVESAQNLADALKSDTFRKIKAEIEGGIIEDLIDDFEPVNDEADMISNVILEDWKNTPLRKLLKEFSW